MTVVVIHHWRNGEDLHFRDGLIVFATIHGAAVWLQAEGFWASDETEWCPNHTYSRGHGWTNRARIHLCEVRP